MENSYPKYDSSCEYSCYSDYMNTNIPDEYFCVDVNFGFLIPCEFPNTYDGMYLIMVYTCSQDGNINEYMLSIDEPKYIYGSNIIPDNIKDIVISSIINNYKTGIESINEYCREQVFDPNRPIPDYWKL